jgi:hypothetical protein
LILKTVSWNSCQNLRADIWLQDKLKLRKGEIYIFLSFYLLLIFECTNHQPISEADLGWSVKPRKAFGIIVSTKSVLFELRFGQAAAELSKMAEINKWEVRQACSLSPTLFYVYLN